MIYLVTGLAFTGAFLLIFGMNMLLLSLAGDRPKELRERLEEELHSQQKKRAKGSMANKELFELAAEGYGELTTQPSFTEQLRSMIEQAGLAMRPEHVLIAMFCCGLLPALAIGAMFNWWAAALVGCVLGALPGIVVGVKRTYRREKLLSQLPDAFELMSRVLRAGQTVAQAMQSVSTEFPQPISGEFAYCWEQQNLGLSPEASMRELARRTGLLELKIFVVAMMIHRSTGGNFAELLDKLARVIRDRYRIRGQIQALTAEGRFQAIILLALAPALMSILYIINRQYVESLFQYPALVFGMIGFELVGFIWMRTIINFDF